MATTKKPDSEKKASLGQKTNVLVLFVNVLLKKKLCEVVMVV